MTHPLTRVASATLFLLLAIGCGRTTFDDEVGERRVSQRTYEVREVVVAREAQNQTRQAVMTDEINEQQLGCPRVCERMQETECDGFASLSGCYEVCEYWDTFFPQLCHPFLRAYFECRGEAEYTCDATGRPEPIGCEEAAQALEECEELAPF